jgi:hypothetical protein
VDWAGTEGPTRSTEGLTVYKHISFRRRLETAAKAVDAARPAREAHAKVTLFTAA